MNQVKVKERNGWYTAFWTEDGKTRKKSLKTKELRIAKKKARQLERDIFAGRIESISQSSVSKTLKEFRNEYLDHLEGKVREGTYRLTERALKCAIISWGDIAISKITVRHIDGFISDLLRSGLSKATANCRYRHLKMALRKAIEWDYMPPLKKWPKELKVEKKNRYIVTEDLRRIFNACDDQDFSEFMLVALYTGLRSGEILRLTGRDIDNPPGRLRVGPEQKNLDDNSVPMAAAVADLLRGRAKSFSKGEKLFPFRDQTEISHRFKALVRASGVDEGIRFHDLRHTFGSRLAMDGRSALQTQKLMRHKAMASTMNYMHLSPDTLAEAVSDLDFGLLPTLRKG